MIAEIGAAQDAFPMPTIWQAIGVLVVIPAAQLLHELAHYVMARLCGAEATIHFSLRESMFVEYYSATRAYSRLLIPLAPVMTGIGVASLWVALFGWPPGSIWLAIIVLGWVDFTFIESVRDLAVLKPYLGAPDEFYEGGAREVIKGLIALDAAVIVMATPYYDGIVHYAVVMPLIVAGGILLTLGAISEDSSNLHPAQETSD